MCVDTTLLRASRAGLIASLICAVSTVEAQIASPADIQRQVDDAFRDVMEQVNSREVRLKYANLLVQARNYEGGIAALEGMLVNPDAPASLRVELAVLYYRLGSYAMSEAYLRDAIADPRLDADLRKQAEVMMVDVAKRNKVSTFSGSVLLGVRTQSNPRNVSDNAQTLSGGILWPNEGRNRPKAATDAQIFARVGHTYDLGAQNEAAIVTSLAGSLNDYSLSSFGESTIRPYDTASIAGTTGVRFKPMPSELPGLDVRPHFAFGYMALKERRYFSAGGAGIEANYRINDRLNLGGVLAANRLNYSSRSDIVNSTLPTGVQRTFKFHGRAEVDVNRVLIAELGYFDRNARRSDFEFSGPEAKLAYVMTYADPIWGAGHNWTTTLSGSVFKRSFRGPDLAVDPLVRRRDIDRRLMLQNVIPLKRDIAVQIQVDYTDVDSNLVNYDYSNVAGSIGMVWSF